MTYIYKMFEHLKQLWMGIWQHIHTDHHRGGRTFQTASHIYVIYILGV
jgi:hypothetical protein